MSYIPLLINSLRRKTILNIFFIFISLSPLLSYGHRGDILAIENVEINTTNQVVTYSFEIENIIEKYLTEVHIEFLQNGKSLDKHVYSMFNASQKFTKDQFSFPTKIIDVEHDFIQIEITHIFNKPNDWGGWDSPNMIKQVNTVASEFYVDAPWRMTKNDPQGNINSIPLHFFLHDADNVSGATLKIDYINIKIKNASSANFGPTLTYNTLPINTLNAMFTSLSPNDAVMSIKSFDLNSFTPTATRTFDFDIETDFLDEFVSVDDTYWYFTFNIPASDLAGMSDVIDIEATISYANLAIPGDDVIRMRIFRTNNDIPTLPNYYRGDTHLHSIYTQSNAEIGLPMSATKEAAKYIGLDWITTTDHTSDFDNYGSQNVLSNWTLLQAETATLNTEDTSMIYILGQEVAVNNSAGQLVHMLAYPNQLSPFGLPFLGDGGGDIVSTSVSIDNVVSQLETVDGFAYASHPFGTFDALPAFPIDGGIWNLGEVGFPTNGGFFAETGGEIICNDPTIPSDIIMADNSIKFIKEGIRGSQIWNMRGSVRVDGSDGNELDPWDVTNSGNPMSQIDTTNFGFHYKRFSQGQEVVNYINQLGLLLKNSNNDLENWKTYYSAGSDAHGSFNNSNTENFAGTGILDNNAVGKVNTITYCPNGMGPNGENVLHALYEGNTSISDGPIITMGISKDGNNSTNDVLMGQDEILDMAFENDIFVNLNFATTDEFGEIVEFIVVVGTENGEIRKSMPLTNTMGNNVESFLLTELLDTIFGIGNTPQEEYFYIRAEIETSRDYSGMTSIYRTDFDIFHSLTNPIWIKWISSIGISEIEQDLISIYPNPSTAILTVKLNNNHNLKSYKIYNSLGQLIIEEKITSELIILDLSLYTKGIYNLVLFDTKGNSLTNKIVKL